MTEKSFFTGIILFVSGLSDFCKAMFVYLIILRRFFNYRGYVVSPERW
jgi:hypothetical protein